MGQTAHGYPYPEPTDTPDVPRDVRALAEKIDADAVLPFAAAALSLTAIASATLYSLKMSLGDHSGGFAIGANDIFLTVPAAGLYLVSARVVCTAGATGRSFAQVKSGALTYRSAWANTEAEGGPSGLFRLPAGGQIQVEAFITASGTPNVSGGLTVVRLSP